jgi:oxygen-independent coproporphyrinogen-3 oxidase
VLDTPMLEAYVSRLDREMVLTARHLDHGQGIHRLHWGGTGATSFSLGQMSDLINRLDARFGLVESNERDYAIEVTPRESNVLTLRHLQALGFNRLILDVRDLDPTAQHTINRIQPRAKVELLVDEAHRLNLDALTMVLGIGLPFQTPDSLDGTLEQVIAMAPARVRIIPPPSIDRLPLKALRYRYQSRGKCGSDQTLMVTTLERLVAAGYVHLGQGHFSRPDDSLALAQEQGRLALDLQGYAIEASGGIQLGLGVAAISRVDDVYARNALTLRGYERALDAGRLATICGLELGTDESLRRDAIERLVCDMAIDTRQFGDAFGDDGDASLAILEHDGLLTRQGQRFVVTPAGRILIGDIIQAFSTIPQGTLP